MVHDRSLVVGLGSNLGSREAFLRAALDLLAHRHGVSVDARSPRYETAPVGPAQPRYVNAAARVRSALGPEELLAAMLDVERRLGRERRERWGARTLDLDLLWIDGTVVDTPSLTVPHPELLRREFALRPLLDVAPDAVDPRDGAPLARALAALTPDASMMARALADGFETEILDHTADEGFVTVADDRADLFAAAAEALGSLIVDPASVHIRTEVPIAITVDAEAGDDERMFAWLSEALYVLDAKRVALRRAVVLDDGPTHVRGVLFGDALDESTHAVRSALKAITWHTLDVGPRPDGRWRAQVVVDV